MPDLRGRAPIGTGQGPGLSDRREGTSGGHEVHTLTTGEMPSHNHAISLTGVEGSVNIPVNTDSGGEDESNPGAGVLANNTNDRFSSEATPNAKYGGQTIPVTITGQGDTLNSGRNLAHNNMQPFLTTNYIIALVGTYPSRN